MTTTSITDRDAVVIHDIALERGGGVQVAEELARTFDAPLYFGICADDVKSRISDDIESYELFTGTIARQVKDVPFLRNLFFMDRFQHVPELHDHEIVIQSGNGTSWYVPTENQILIRYVHSPPGPPYHRFHAVGGTRLNRWNAFVSRILRQPYVDFPDLQLANSETTQNRLKKYFDIHAEVVYPPIDVDAYDTFPSDEFYFTLSRLTEAKNVNEIVRTFTDDYPEKRLIVGGSGPTERYLREIAGENVDIRGWLDEEEKHRLLGSCKALVLNSGNESFGIVPIEAFASGTPVIGLNRGHTTYQIEDGWNGLLYEPGRLSDAIRRFETEGVSASRVEIEEFSEQFSFATFRKRTRNFVKSIPELEHN